MVRVTVSGRITDTGSGLKADSAAYSVVDSYKQLKLNGAIVVRSRGNYSFDILLLAARLGTDEGGRRYTVIVSAKDNADNVGKASAIVIVPHDQRR
jgi:hypothetical protein